MKKNKIIRKIIFYLLFFLFGLWIISPETPLGVREMRYAKMNIYLARLGIKNINSRNFYLNKTVLMDCCLYGSYNEAMYFIKKGANVNLKDSDGNTALMYAIIFDSNIVKELVERNADIKYRNNEGLTPLHEACKRNNIDIIKCLIDHGALINCKDDYENTPLIYACMYSDVDTIKYLIEKGANVNCKSSYYTPLRIAKKNKNKKLIKILKEAGAKE